MQLDESDLQSRAERLVQNEVNCCLSVLVSTLAGSDYEAGADDLGELLDQARELSYPVPDYEEAAIQAGWTVRPRTVSSDGTVSDECVVRGTTEEDPEYASGFKYAENFQEACELDDLEPYDREVFEHWAVSNWLAGELDALGEKVDTDFAGLNVWARTTTGQAISLDGVIRQIVQNLHDHFGG